MGEGTGIDLIGIDLYGIWYRNVLQVLYIFDS